MNSENAKYLELIMRPDNQHAENYMLKVNLGFLFLILHLINELLFLGTLLATG